jgi:dTDP-4-dehydrorhamnose reductase
VPDLVNASLDILIDGESGLWHLANQGALSWADFARRTAELAGLDSKLIVDCSTDELNYAARRPVYSVLESERGVLLPKLDDALNRFVSSVKANCKF